MNKKGFSIVELMIVVAILLIIAAIAVPNLLVARMKANEDAAQKVLRDTHVQLENYREHCGGVYPSPTTPPPTGVCLDTFLSLQGTVLLRPVRGYVFSYTPRSGSGYVVAATPVRPGETGRYNFSINEEGMGSSYVNRGLHGPGGKAAGARK